MPLLSNFAGSEGDLLSTYSADWVKHTSSSGTAEIANGRARQTNTTTAFYYFNGWTPASADYEVYADAWVESNSGDRASGVCVRMSTSAATMYLFRANVFASAYQAFKIVSGSSTQLGSNVSATFNNATAYQIKLRASGTTISAYKEGEGTPIISVTDSAISAAGKAGLRFFDSAGPTDLSGVHIDNFGADDLSAPSSSIATKVWHCRQQGFM